VKLTKEEILKRITELHGKLTALYAKPKRFQYGGHYENIAKLEGEINGLQWCLKYYDLGYYETERQEVVTSEN